MMTIYLVDASVYIFRAWFSLPLSMTDPRGRPVNALYGWARFLAAFTREVGDAPVGVAFDESLTTSFRNAIYPLYKANRELPPPELEQQLDRCRELCGLMGLAHFASPTWEADDIIGTLAERARRRRAPVTVVSADKDLAQLIGPRDRWWHYAAGRVLDEQGVHAALGVWPAQVPDLLALAGDAVDNIPGVRGIGVKTAVALLDHFGSLDAVYARLDQVAGLPLRGAASVAKKLAAGRAEAELSLRLATIARDADVGDGRLDRRVPDAAALAAFRKAAGFRG